MSSESCLNMAAQKQYVRAHTTVLVDASLGTVVRVRNLDNWPREDFLNWLDREKDRANFKNDFELAEAAGISHSSISGWRTGRQRPSTVTLSKVAQALGVKSREAWLKAGAMAPSDLERASTPTIREDIALIARAIEDPDTSPEDLIVIEATLQMLLTRIAPTAKPRK